MPALSTLSFLTVHLFPRNTVFLASNDKEQLRMKLADCPYELHCYILPHTSQLNDLINLLSVSHNFRYFAELLLHRIIDFNVLCITKECVNLESSNGSLDDTLYSFQKPIGLLETWTAHPDLGCKTGRLSLAVLGWAWYTHFQLHERFRSLSKLRGLSFTPAPVCCAGGAPM